VVPTEKIPGLGREWLWPAADTECRKVIFSTIQDLMKVLSFCSAKQCAVQAGGNMGVWPWVLAKHFKQVITFEPDPDCFALLTENLGQTLNITAFQCALLDRTLTCRVVPEGGNLGAQYVEVGGTVPAGTIDSLALTACDLVYLDIEGAEMPALQGAIQTIEKFHPVIAVEDKGLSTRFGFAQGDIENWLVVEHGYTAVRKYHRDVVFACV
jgi:FkbM family methyltransferase